MSKRLAWAASVLTVVLATGCGATKIGRINADPMRYHNRSVTVEGRVTSAFGALVAGGYQVEDDTGKILVISTGSGVPTKGQRVKVEGRVTPGVTFMGRSVGNAIRETEHKVKF